MHLWPSMRIRDSFKLAYLRKLEWNLHRMKSEKRQSPSSNQEKLLDDDEGDAVLEAKADSENHAGGFLSVCRELIMILSCCYCCFCCGVCINEEEN